MRSPAATVVAVLDPGRDQTRGAAVVADIETAGGQAVFVSSDLTGPPEALRAFTRAASEAAGGSLDAVFHNAALCPAVDTVSLTDADLDATLAVNVGAPHVLTAALAPAMAERGHGTIVVIGSWMAHVGHPFVGLYSATKAAEIQLARSWAAEFGPRGVRVNTVSPGATRTPINASNDDVIAHMTAGTPAGRPGTPKEIADVWAPTTARDDTPRLSNYTVTSARFSHTMPLPGYRMPSALRRTRRRGAHAGLGRAGARRWRNPAKCLKPPCRVRPLRWSDASSAHERGRAPNGIFQGV